MPINLRCRVNKSMEIAQFSLKSGQFLSAREMFNMGFRYSHGETTPDGISAVMNKLHESSRFILLRQVRKEKNGEPTRIMVTEIKEREGPNRGRNDLLPHEADRWRWLLTRKSAVRYNAPTENEADRGL